VQPSSAASGPCLLVLLFTVSDAQDTPPGHPPGIPLIKEVATAPRAGFHPPSSRPFLPPVSPQQQAGHGPQQVTHSRQLAAVHSHLKRQQPRHKSGKVHGKRLKGRHKGRAAGSRQQQQAAVADSSSSRQQ
jgi:hypothetical protein